MSLKKFIAPNLVVVLLLSVFWFAGVDSVIDHDNSHRENLQKYLQVQRKLIDNYVSPLKISNLYKESIKGMVRNLSDSTMAVAGTPLDTTFKDVEISDIRDAFTHFEEAYLYLSNKNPDENMTARTEDAIRGMFTELDPHSVYIEPEESERIEEDFAGKFQGIGIQFDIIKDTITVVTAISGGPSDQLGIMSGDRIVRIDDSTAVGFTQKQVVNTLRGPKGSEVDVTIKRPHTQNLLHFNIVRDDIPLYTVDTSYMLDSKTGYVKINRFAATTHEEFMKAMKKMKDEGMQRVVIDLRNNPGGYLGQAIAIAEEFFDRGTKIVSTHSRHVRFNSEYYSRRTGAFRNLPLIVLVNEGSASASEIVSGAIQDHDRGLIVGRRTFGKGLVQQQYTLVDSSNIRVTISKYYTPSGRLIQKPYKDKDRQEYAYELYKRENNAVVDAREFIEHVPDSLRYKTDAGRIVYGGGGIVPDHIIQEDTTESAAIFNFMRRKRVGFDFVRNYLDNNGKEFRASWGDDYSKFRKDFQWSDQQMDEFHKMLLDRGLVETDTVDTPDFKNDTLYVPTGQFQKVKWMPEAYMKADLARQVWSLDKYYQIINDGFDDTLKKTMGLWAEVQELHKLAQNGSVSQPIGNLNRDN